MFQSFLKALHVDEFKGAHPVEDRHIRSPKFFGGASNRDDRHIKVVGAPKERVENVVRPLLCFEADAGEEPLVLLGAGLDDFCGLLLLGRQKIADELFGGLTCALLDADERLDANAGRIRLFAAARILASQHPMIDWPMMSLGVEPIFRAGNLAASRFKNLGDEYGSWSFGEC